MIHDHMDNKNVLPAKCLPYYDRRTFTFGLYSDWWALCLNFKTAAFSHLLMFGCDVCCAPDCDHSLLVNRIF